MILTSNCFIYRAIHERYYIYDLFVTPHCMFIFLGIFIKVIWINSIFTHLMRIFTHFEQSYHLTIKFYCLNIEFILLIFDFIIFASQ